MKNNLNVKSIKVLVLLLLMGMCLGNVFAKDINIFPKRQAGAEGEVRYRLYESPHSGTASKFFSKAKPGEFIPSTSRLNGTDSGSAPVSNGYHNHSFILSTAPLSEYTIGNGVDNTRYGYITYNAKYEDFVAGQAPPEFSSAARTFCKRPISKSNFGQYILAEFPGYNYDKTGYGEWAFTLLCVNHSPSNCNKSHLSHAYVSENYINADVYAQMKRACVGRTLKDQYGEYIYLSEGKKVGGQGQAVMKTAGEFYNATVNTNGTSNWADSQKGGTHGTATQSLINVYDNKLYFPEPLESKIIFRYYDIANNGTNLEKSKGSSITLNKIDHSNFTQADLDNMLIGTEEKTYKPGSCIEIPQKDNMLLLGTNKKVGGQRDYTGSNKIVIGDLNTTKICPTNDENTKDVYVDVFYNSAKRVYIRHIDVTNKYNPNTHEVTGLTPQTVASAAKFLKTQPAFADMFKANNNAYLGRVNSITPLTGYQEEYNINVFNYIETHNILNVKKDYIGYKMGVDYNRTTAMNKLNSNYTGTVKFDNKGSNANKDEDIRTFSAKGDEVTFIDMFYVVNPDPNIPLNPPDITPGKDPEVPNKGDPENPGSKPSGGCVEIGDNGNGGNGIALKPVGSLYFESRVDGIKEATPNEFGKALEDDKVPSGEELYYGPLGVYPYMMGTAIYKDNKGSIYISNGKNMSKIPYNFRSLDYLGFYTIKDNVEVYDNVAQKGGKLFSHGDNDQVLRAPLSDQYLSQAASSHIDKGDYIPKLVTERREGGNEYYIDTYIELTVKNDGVVFGATDVVIPTYNQVYRKKIREDKYVNDGNGNFVMDKLATIYYTQEEVPTVQESNHKNLVDKDIKKARTPEVVKDMSYLYKNNASVVPVDKYNGKRILSSRLQYERNNGAYVDNSCNIQDTVGELHMNEANKNAEPVVVLTPVIANMNLKSDKNFVDHTQNDITGEVVQRNVPFEVNILTSGITHPTYPMMKDYEKYTQKTEIKFSFGIKYYKCYDKNGNLVADVPTALPAGSWIEVPVGGKIVTQALYAEGDMNQSEEANTLEGTYTVKAYAVNSPKSDKFFEDGRVDSLDLSDNRYNIISKKHNQYHGLTLDKETKYIARNTKKTLTIGRMYDFKITDVVDIDWKNVFRKDNAIDHTGNFYHSGISKWNMYASTANQMEDRKENEIGRNPQRILPVGPSKHTNLNYGKAPKMGYKFAFDLKTTGKIGDTTKKYIDIVPEYYYISKDGSKFYDSSKIDLYYMNSSKKYVKVGSSADRYKITMRPADGIRYISEYEKSFNKSNLSTNTISIGSLSKLRLDMDKNLVTNEKNFVQLWYGEFKLPNSTIAVLKDNPDLENPLKDGYIGVKFNITCVEKNESREIVLSYNTNDKNKPGVPNTSQWDYERYMKVKPEAPYELGYKLEKGVWNINNDVFNRIKGTVMLYDTDEKAASDFDVGAGK